MHACRKLRGFPSGSVVKNLPVIRSLRKCRFDPWVRKIPLKRAQQPTPVFLPGEFRGQRNLVGYSLWGPKQLDVTE